MCLYHFSVFFQTKIFTRVEDIPKEFITQHIKLLGKVTNVEDQGVLQVKHIPIVRLPFVAQKRGKFSETEKEGTN